MAQTVSPQACGLSQELPVITNVSQPAGASTMTFKYMANDQYISTPTPIPSKLVTGQCYYAISPQFVPTVDHYVADTWDARVIPDQTAVDILNGACSKSGVQTKLLRPDAAAQDSSGNFSRVVSNAGYTQVIHGLTGHESMFGVILPPGWRSDAAPGTYPILFQEIYAVSDEIAGGMAFTGLISESAKRGAPVIGVYWNGGGLVGGLSMTSHSRVLFDQIVNHVAQTFRGDVNRIVMKGLSRGAGAALSIASNPDPHHYTVRYISAGNPPIAFGRDTAFVGGATFPAYSVLALQNIGLEDVSSPGWTYPACAGHPELQGLSARQALLKILSGTSDPDIADNYLMPIAPRMISALKRAGTQIFLHVSTNDAVLPLGPSLSYVQKLKSAGVPLELKFLLADGHNRDMSVIDAHVLDALLALSRGVNPTVQNGSVSFEKFDRMTGAFLPWSRTGNTPPFTLVIPLATTPGMSSQIYASGIPGTSYRIEFKKRETGEITSQSSFIKPDFSDAINIAPPVGTYDVTSLKIRTPYDPSWRSLSLRDTTTANADRLYMKSVQSFSALSAIDLYLEMVKDLHPPAGMGVTQVAWGITELSSTVPEGQTDFRIRLQYVDGAGAPREFVSSSANANDGVTMKQGTPYSWNLEEFGVDHTKAFSCSLLSAAGAVTDCSSGFFQTVSGAAGGAAPGPLVFSFSYNGAVYTRTINVALQ